MTAPSPDDPSLSDPTLLLCPTCAQPMRAPGGEPHRCSGRLPDAPEKTPTWARTQVTPAEDLDRTTKLSGEGSGSGAVVGEVAGALAPGDTICDGRYLVHRLLGRGAMGEVYRAQDTASTLGTPVVLKLIHPQWLGEEVYAQRFRREAEAARLLKHEAIVRVNYLAEDKQRKLLVMEMEFAGERTLKDLLRERGRLEPAEALGMARHVLEGLAHAHGKGVVHRDIKPSNLIVAADGSLKIADFGLAKLTERPAGDVTLTGSRGPMGTPNYWSPEQARDAKHTDARADLYSMGVVLYEMLTGQLPTVDFQTPLRRAAVPEAVDAVLLKALRTAPEDRYESAAGFLRALEGVSARPAPSPGASSPAIPTPPPGPAAVPPPPGAASASIPTPPPGPSAAAVLRGVPVKKSDGKAPVAVRVARDEPGAHPTIAAAIAAAPDGGTVLVKPGTYDEALAISRPLILEADGGPGSVVIQSAGPVCITLDGTPILRGLTIRNLAEKETYHGGAVQLRSGGARLERCTVNARFGAGILLTGGTNHVVWKCRIHDTRLFGLWIGARAGGTIEGCEVFRTGSTGVLISSTAARLRGCRIHAVLAGGGVEVDGQAAALLEACEIKGNPGSGVVVRRGCTAKLVDCLVHGNSPPQARVEDGGRLIQERSHLDDRAPGPGFASKL